jgi:hypothetical protein
MIEPGFALEEDRDGMVLVIATQENRGHRALVVAHAVGDGEAQFVGVEILDRGHIGGGHRHMLQRCMDRAAPADNIERLVGQAEHHRVAFRVLHREGALVEQLRRRGDESNALFLHMRAQHLQRLGIAAGKGSIAQFVRPALLEQHAAGGAATDKA